MSPRPRTTSDADILAATARVVGRLGPGKMTLADVAREVGLAPATLVQRFGSKRSLLLELARGGTGDVGEQFAALRRGSPLETVHAFAACMAAMARTPEEMSNHLAFLQIDLTDPDFHALALEHGRATRRELAALLDRAVAAGELVPCDTDRLARTVQTAMSGALLMWAIFREGSAEAWVREDVEAVLGPWRAGGGEAGGGEGGRETGGGGGPES